MSRIKRRLSLKLSLGILLMTAPIFALALGLLFLQSRRYIRKEASERAASLLSMTTQHVRNYMSTVETAANANAWLLEEFFTPDSLESITRRIVMLNQHVKSCAVSTELETFPHRTPIDLGKPCWVAPFAEQAEGNIDPDEAVATYCRPLRRADGKIVGVLSVDLSFRELAKNIGSIHQAYPHAYFMLLGGDGRYFIHPDTTRLFRKTIFSGLDSVRHKDIMTLGHEMTNGRKGDMHADINGQLCHVCYNPIPGTNWSLALVCPDKDILKSYDRLTYIIIALIAVGLLVILWLCYRAVNHAIRPLNRLLSISQKIADGCHEEQIPRSRREDAIGRLQNSFATMQRSLDEHMGSIRQTTEETRKRNQELAQAMKLAEEALRQKTLFIQNVSHQIRTPLNIILGFADILADSLSQRKKAQDVLQEEELANISEIMKHNANHLNRMILMLYDSSDTGSYKEMLSHHNDRVSCNELARECIAFTYTHFADINVSFSTELPDDACIRTNHLYLMRTLRELLYNSAKYSDGKHIRMIVSQTETTVRFTVEDEGPGIPEESLELLFKPFVKVDDLSEGLGLGLPLSKRHATSLGGDILLDSSYRKGCRITAEIPK